MSIKLKAVERKQTVGIYKGDYRYVMQTELYNRLGPQKVIEEASLRSGIRRASINAAWEAIGDVIRAWATEGHSVAVPGLGTMRFGVRATSVSDVNKVSTDLITSRRVIFTPSTDIKKELHETSINITCYDRDGNIVKRVISADEGNVEDPEQSEQQGEQNQQGNQNQGEQQGNQNQGTGQVTVLFKSHGGETLKTMQVSVGGSIQQSDLPAASAEYKWNSLTSINNQIASATAGQTVTITEVRADDSF